MILRLTLASGWMFPKKSQSVLQAGNAIRRTDRVAGRRSSPLSSGLRRQMQSLSRGGHVALWLHADAIPK
jgi:hypothetical protein